MWALVVNIFWPLITHSSPSRDGPGLDGGHVGARLGLGEAEGDGDLAGERPSGRISACSSSVPTAAITWATIVVVDTA